MKIEIFEKKFKFTYENLNLKLTLNRKFQLLSRLPGPLSSYTHLENKTIFLQQFFRCRGEASPLPLPRAPLLINSQY